MRRNKNSSTSLIWYRNDLRTADHSGLQAACGNAQEVIAVYCIDPRQFGKDQYGFERTDAYRAQFLVETLNDLSRQLQDLGIPFMVTQGKPEDLIPAWIEEYRVDTIHYQEEWTRDEQQVSDEVFAKITEDIEVIGHYDQFLFHPHDAPIRPDQVPEVFTAFRKKLERYAQVRPPHKGLTRLGQNHAVLNPQLTIEDIGVVPKPADPRAAIQLKGGSQSAKKRLQHYFWNTKKLSYYKKTRNGLLGPDYSSKFSPWLANGSLSARTIYKQIKDYEQMHGSNQSTYWLIFELIWRDYFKYISLKHGNRIFFPSGINGKNQIGKVDQQVIQAWTQGRTNSDFVNANMIELAQTGWMSNRGRQVVASYFTKTLGLDWRIGAAWFESQLVDYDVHSNYGNWLYVAGVGNDPRDRVFNPELQADRYDPDGRFRRTWLQPQLAL